MLFYTVVACILAFSSSVIGESEAEIKTEGNVLILTEGNFENALKLHEHILVEFCK